jgi:solute carrier family 25 protein 33/36
MKFSGPHTSSAQAHLGVDETQKNIGKDIIVQSRETGDVVPQPPHPSIPSADKKDQAKPFAHFVAGG